MRTLSVTESLIIFSFWKKNDAMLSRFFSSQIVNEKIDLCAAANGTHLTFVYWSRYCCFHDSKIKHLTAIAALNHFNSQHKPPPHMVLLFSLTRRFLLLRLLQKKTRKSKGCSIVLAVSSEHIESPQCDSVCFVSPINLHAKFKQTFAVKKASQEFKGLILLSGRMLHFTCMSTVQYARRTHIRIYECKCKLGLG